MNLSFGEKVLSFDNWNMAGLFRLSCFQDNDVAGSNIYIYIYVYNRQLENMVSRCDMIDYASTEQCFKFTLLRSRITWSKAGIYKHCELRKTYDNSWLWLSKLSRDEIRVESRLSVLENLTSRHFNLRCNLCTFFN